MHRGWLPAGILLLTSCSGPYSARPVAAKGEPAPVGVRMETVAARHIPETLAVTGELYAEDQVTLSPKVPGRLLKLTIDIGSQVAAGEVVAQVETTDYEFRVRQAEALVEQTRARMGLSGSSGDRVEPADTAIVKQAAASLREATLLHANATRLFQQGISSKVDFERAGVALQAAQARHQASIEEVYQLQAQLAERRAQVELARQQLTDTSIRAPFEGAITRRMASPGEYLPVNAPVAQLVRQHPIRIRLSVPERLAPKVKPGQRIDVRLEGSAGYRTGRTVRLSPALEAQNRSLVVEGELPNEDGRLRPGSFVEALIVVDPAAMGLAVPSGAVISFAGVERVFLARDGVLVEQTVKTGQPLEHGRVQIVDGLRPGDQLVLDPSDRLRPGLRVRPLDR